MLEHFGKFQTFCGNFGDEKMKSPKTSKNEGSLQDFFWRAKRAGKIHFWDFQKKHCPGVKHLGKYFENNQIALFLIGFRYGGCPKRGCFTVIECLKLSTS